MKIGIIGLGLIGGSLLKDLTLNSEHELYAVTRSKTTLDKVKSLVTECSDNISILSGCEIVFAATPINKTLEILDELETVVNKNCIVLDCASIKGFTAQKKRPYKFIGSHPMAGTENNGFDASFQGLFKGAKWVLTPSVDISRNDIEKITGLIGETGAKIIITTPDEHDMAAALISHMPMLISQALFKTAQNNELAMKLASSGFRDMTRLAMSNPEMANDMLQYNGENIKKSLEMLQKSLNYLLGTKYFEKITDIKNTRSKMYSDEGKNLL